LPSLQVHLTNILQQSGLIASPTANPLCKVNQKSLFIAGPYLPRAVGRWWWPDRSSNKARTCAPPIF